MLKSSLMLSVVFAVAQVPAALPPLFDAGRSEWQVVVAADASPCLRYAAEEFTNAIARVSGVVLPVVESDAGVAHAVRIVADENDWTPEQVSYRLRGGDLLLTGNQPRAALHATYAFLDRELGVRWLWPGEDGAFFPSRRTWTFPQSFGFSHSPAIWFRGFHHCGDWRDRHEFLKWESRNYVNIHRHGNWKGEEKYGHFSMLASHNANLNGEKQLFAEHPECFALLGGHRSMANICFSSDLGVQKVAERLDREIERRTKQSRMDIISIFPNDNQDYCQCDACREKGVSTGWFEFFNKVVKILKAKYPTLHFSTLAYQGYLNVPTCKFENVDFIEYASHPRCHIHKWDDPNCAANARELKRLREWCARSDVRMGHYAYEYDAISGHPIFMPFFSMIGDAVEKAVELGLVTQFPEVGLSPKTGPDIQAHAIQNRLTELFYARKMWDPSLKLESFLDDLCATAFGAAAQPMREYFLMMDAAWGRMDGQISLFADGMNVSAKLLADEKVRARAVELLAAAERLVANDTRSLRNVMREKALHQQWVDYRELRLGNNISFKLPKVEAGECLGEGASPKTTLKTTDGKDSPVRVLGYWTPKKEIVFVFMGVAKGEVTLVDAYSERYTFGFEQGRKTQRRISDVGVEMTTWKPEWTAKPMLGKQLFMRLPLSAFGHEPQVNESWDVRFASSGAAYPMRKDMTVKLAFLAAPAAERPIVYYAGDRRCYGSIPGQRSQAESDGWRLIACTNAAELAAAVTKADSYMLQIPDAAAFTPEVAAVIRERVYNGGSLLARSWATVPLQKIFGDPNLVSRCEEPKGYPLSERHAKFVREGDWCKKPWDIERAVRHGYSPCYMQVPYAPQGEWVTYAAMPSRKDEPRLIPFVSALKYGRGVVILVGESMGVSHYRLIDNIRRDLGL